LEEAISNLDTENFNNDIEKAYQDLQNISFDVGVLEKSESIYTVRGFFDWNDMGSMDALSKTLAKDSKGNSVLGGYFGLETSNCVIYSEDRLIATIGIDNMIVASTKDAIIVCPRDMDQDIKELVKELKLNGYDDFI
jgi:mannose-1-phosphate guanylyltransferase